MIGTPLAFHAKNTLVYLVPDMRLQNSYRVIGRPVQAPQNVVLEDVHGKRIVRHESERVFSTANIYL